MKKSVNDSSAEDEAHKFHFRPLAMVTAVERCIVGQSVRTVQTPTSFIFRTELRVRAMTHFFLGQHDPLFFGHFSLQSQDACTTSWENGLWLQKECQKFSKIKKFIQE